MKGVFQILLVTLFFVLVLSQTKESIDKKKLDPKKLAKFRKAFKKIKKYNRYLDQIDTTEPGSSESESGFSDTTAPEPPYTSPSTNSTAFKRVRLMGYNNFKSKRPDNGQPVSTLNPIVITFRVFIYFLNVPFYPRVTFTVQITNHRFRALQDDAVKNETVQCKLNETAIQGNLGCYDCETETDIEPNEVSSNNDIKFLDANNKEVVLPTDSGEVELADLALEEGESLQLQNSTTFSYVIFQNISHYVEDDNKTFHIIGELTGTDTDKVLKQSSIPVTFYTDDNKEITIDCSTSGDENPFELTCIAPYDFDAKINDAKAEVDGVPITFSASTEVANNLHIEGTGSSSESNKNHLYYRKNSSGLSGGAIAGIVIACAIVLILITLLAMYLRKPKPAIDSNTTIVGLRSVDNYQE